MKSHQQFEVYEVTENGELIRESSVNQCLIDSAEKQNNNNVNQPEISSHKSIENENLEDTPEVFQSKRKYIFEKCFSIVHKENTKIQTKCMLCETGKNIFIKGDERSVSNFVSHLKVENNNKFIIAKLNNISFLKYWFFTCISQRIINIQRFVLKVVSRPINK